jgi:hypothetical protein
MAITLIVIVSAVAPIAVSRFTYPLKEAVSTESIVTEELRIAFVVPHGVATTIGGFLKPISNDPLNVTIASAAAFFTVIEI